MADFVSLSECADLIMGQSPPSTSYNSSGNGLPFFQGKTDFGERYPRVRVWCDQPTKIAEAGDILISVRAPVGPTNVAEVRSCLGRGIAAIRAKADMDASYLLFFLRHYEPRLAEAGKGSTFEAVSRSDLEEIQVPQRHFCEQQAIAQRLERADRLRRLRQHALTTGDQYLQNVFLDMFGDPETNPKGWEREELGELILRFEGGTNFPPVADSAPASKYRVLKISAVTWGNFDPAESKPIAVETQIKPEIIVKKGDLLFSRANTTELVGSVSMVTEDPPPVVLPDKVWRIVFRPDTRLDPYYTMSFLRSPATRRQIADLATGSSGSMKNISMGKANTLILAVPPIELQQQYALVVQKHERLRRMQVEALRQAEQLYETLLEEAFTP